MEDVEDVYCRPYDALGLSGVYGRSSQTVGK
jgi:hypothetical protein